MSEKKEFKVDWKAVFEPDDYLYFYYEGLAGERNKMEVDFIARELNLTKLKKILDFGLKSGKL